MGRNYLSIPKLQRCNFIPQLVLAPYTVKIRGGRHPATTRKGRIIEMNSCPTALHSYDKRRTFDLSPPPHKLSQAHVLPSYSVKIRRGRLTFHHHQMNSVIGKPFKCNHSSSPIQLEHLEQRMPPNLPNSCIAPWSLLHLKKLRAKYVQ